MNLKEYTKTIELALIHKNIHYLHNKGEHL